MFVHMFDSRVRRRLATVCQNMRTRRGLPLKREPKTCLANCAELFELYSQGKIQPLVGQVYPLEQYAAALNQFINRQALGKIVLRVRNK